MPEKQLNMNGELMKKIISDLTLEQQLELETLAAMSDNEINTEDIPEILLGRQEGLKVLCGKDYSKKKKDKIPYKTVHCPSKRT